MLDFLINWIGFNKIIALPKHRLLNSTLLIKVFSCQNLFLDQFLYLFILRHKFWKLTGCKNQGELIPRTNSAQEILRIIPNSFIKVSLLSESVHEPLFFKHRHSQEDLVKFMFSKKATKIDEIFTFNLTLIR